MNVHSQRKRWPRRAGLCLSLSLLFSTTVRAHVQRTEGVGYKRYVAIGFMTYQQGALCIPFVGTMTSGNFFEGLTVSQMKGERKFFKGSNEVTQYPDVIVVVIVARVMDCSKSPPQQLTYEAKQDFMNLLSIKVTWKTELEERAAETPSIEIVKPVWAETSEIPIWNYVVTIKSKRVPLTDHLIVRVYSGEGKLMARMAGRP